MSKGRYGIHGGQYISETLMNELIHLEECYEHYKKDPEFNAELNKLLNEYAGRPSLLYYAEKMTKDLGGAKIYLKREDLNHTGSHKINNALGQALLAKKMGKTRLIAETGAGQHGVATATAAAFLGMECEIFMGKEDTDRQALNVYRMELLGAKVHPVTSGTMTLKDAVNETMREWSNRVADTHYVLGSVMGPHPFPMIVRDFQSVISQEAKEQIEQAVRIYLMKDEYGDYRIPIERQRPVFLLGAPGIGKTAVMEQIAQEMDIDPEYASLVIPTMVICKNFLEIFQAESVWVPGVSLLDGIAYDYGEKKKFIKSVHNFENDILVASKNIAKRYSTGKDHIKGTTDIALTIFDSMKKVHGMGARERLLLQIAVQLHDCGKYISMADVAECSYRIIMATEIIGLSTEERKVIASAVRYNTTEFVYYGNYDDGPEIDRERYLLVAKLTAILRLANAMDRSHYQKVESLRVVLKDRELQMIIDSSRDISLELGLLRDKVKFFEEVFGIRLVLKRKRRA